MNANLVMASTPAFAETDGTTYGVPSCVYIAEIARKLAPTRHHAKSKEIRRHIESNVEPVSVLNMIS